MSGEEIDNALLWEFAAEKRWISVKDGPPKEDEDGQNIY